MSVNRNVITFFAQLVVIIIPLVPSSATALQVRLWAVVVALPTPIVWGSANLPDGTQLLLSVSKAGFLAQANTIVKDHKYTAGPFSNGSGPLQPGVYSLDVSTGSMAAQPDAVQQVLGSQGQNLEGDNLVPDPLQPGGQYVDEVFQFIVYPGQTTPNVDPFTAAPYQQPPDQPLGAPN